MSFITELLAIPLSLTLISGDPPLPADLECAQQPPPVVEINMIKGDIYTSQTKDARTLAREKAREYGEKMPLRQGHLGEVVMKVHYEHDTGTHAVPPCLYIENIKMTFRIDHRLQIAVEHPEGSCVYDELYAFELEQMQEDMDLAQNYINHLEQSLREQLAQKYIYGPLAPNEFDPREFQLRGYVKDMAMGYKQAILDALAKSRRENDWPQLYNEIRADCGLPPVQ